MSDPVITACPEGVWTLVAANKTVGFIHIKVISPSAYYQTYRDTGGGAPTLVSEGIPFKGSLQISASAPIDVYVWCKGAEGSVRVDL